HPRVRHLVTRLRIDDYMHLNELVLILLANDQNNNDILFPRLKRFDLWGWYEDTHLSTFLCHPSLFTLRHVNINMDRCLFNYLNMNILLQCTSLQLKIAPLETLKLIYRTVNPPPIAERVKTFQTTIGSWLRVLPIDRPIMVWNSLVQLTLSISERTILWLLLDTCPMPSLILLDVTFEYDANPRYPVDKLTIMNGTSNFVELRTLRLKNSPFGFIQRLLDSFNMSRIDTVSFINIYDNAQANSVCSNDAWSRLITSRLPHLHQFELKVLIDPIPLPAAIDRLIQSFCFDPVLSSWPVSAFIDERFNHSRDFAHLKEASRLVLHTLPYPGRRDVMDELWNFDIVSKRREALRTASHIGRHINWYVNETIQYDESFKLLSKLMTRRVRSIRLVYSAVDESEPKEKQQENGIGSLPTLCCDIVELKLKFDRTPSATKINLVECLFAQLAPFIRKLELDAADIEDGRWLLWQALLARQRITHLDIRFKSALNNDFSPVKQISSTFPYLTHLSVTGIYMQPDSLVRVAVELLCLWPHTTHIQRLRLGYLYPKKNYFQYENVKYINTALLRSLAVYEPSTQLSHRFHQNSLLIWR
ncbi:unnamed protein product, partial [Adineta ricciae]